MAKRVLPEGMSRGRIIALREVEVQKTKRGTLCLRCAPCGHREGRVTSLVAAAAGFTCGDCGERWSGRRWERFDERRAEWVKSGYSMGRA